MSIIRSAALVRAKKFDISVLCEEARRIAEDGRYAAAVAIGVDEGRSVEAIASGLSDLEAAVGFLEGDGFRVAVAGEAGGEVIGGVKEPSVACFGREQDKLADGDNASVLSGGPSLDVANLVGESKPRAVEHSFARSGLDRPLRGAKRWTSSPSCSASSWSSSITASIGLSFTAI